MHYISVLFSLLIMATITDAKPSTSPHQTKIDIDNHIAYLIGKNNVTFAKKVVLGAIVTSFGWLTARYFLNPYLKYTFCNVEVETAWDSSTHLGKAIVENNNSLVTTTYTQEEIPAGYFKSFWQTFFFITKYEKDGSGCAQNWDYIETKTVKHS